MLNFLRTGKFARHFIFRLGKTTFGMPTRRQFECPKCGLKCSNNKYWTGKRIEQLNRLRINAGIKKPKRSWCPDDDNVVKSMVRKFAPYSKKSCGCTRCEQMKAFCEKNKHALNPQVKSKSIYPIKIEITCQSCPAFSIVLPDANNHAVDSQQPDEKKPEQKMQTEPKAQRTEAKKCGRCKGEYYSSDYVEGYCNACTCANKHVLRENEFCAGRVCSTCQDSAKLTGLQ